MLLLNFLSDTLIHTALVVGLIGIIVSYFSALIPFIDKYILPIRAISVILLVFGIYGEGKISNEEKWQERVAELEQKIKVAEEKSKEVNTVIQTKVVEKTKKVKEIEYQTIEKIKEVEKLIDAKCELDPAVIDILNNAAKGPTQ